MPSLRPDVLVAGAGPSGTALAAELAGLGLRVLVVAPAPHRPWPASYSAWTDELAGGSALDRTRHRWPQVTLADDAGAVALPRSYARLDTAGLQRHLVARAADAGVRWHDAAATGVTSDTAGSTASCRDGSSLRAALVVDATGSRAALVERATGDTGVRAVQAAYGLVADFAVPPIAPGSAVLMDWSTSHLPSGERHADPTFLYAMHLGGDTYFVEETSLARRPALPYDVLSRRLDARLAARAAPAGSVHAVEHVRIPMDPPLPRAGQRVLATGAAASLVHPATGYLVAASLRSAPRVASAVARGLGGPGGSPERAAALGWDAVWPADRVRRHRLHAFGLEALLGGDPALTAQFFRSFFALPVASWADYLSGTQSSAATAATMTRLYAAATPELRRALRGAALGPHRAALLAARSGRLPAR